MSDNLKILVFTPAKNEGASIAKVATECRRVIEGRYQVTPDILVISDGSTDNTVEEAQKVGAEVIAHESSRGLGTIFQEAVDFATLNKYDLLLTIDGDRQFSESEIPNLIDPILNSEADFCSGNRFATGEKIPNMSGTKRVGNKIVASMVNYILGGKYTDVSCGFRAYSREALLHLNLFGGFTYTQEVFLNLGFKGLKIKEVPISVKYFKTRKSRIARSILRYGTQVLKIMLSSLIFYKPMKFFGTITTILWLYAIPTVGILLWRYLETGLITPYKAVGISALAAFSIGVILLTVGVILYSLSRQQISIDKLHYYVKRGQ